MRFVKKHNKAGAVNGLYTFWKTQLNKQKSKGKLSKILQAALDEKRREVIKKRSANNITNI
jgi:hypothetical protein